MTLLRTAVAVEARKALHSRVLLGTTILLIGGVAALGGLTSAAVRGGNPELIAKLGPEAAQGGWPGLLGTVYQVTAAAGLLAFGVALSWSFGREFAEGTITGLFGLPVSRATLALAKLVVHLVWTAAVTVVLTIVVLIVGTASSLGAPDAVGLARLAGLTAMTGALAVPASWAATLGRGLLPGIATTVGLMAVAQIIVVAGGVSGWFPYSAPALWAIMPGTVTAAQLVFAGVVTAGLGALTVLSWRRLQLDR